MKPKTIRPAKRLKITLVLFSVVLTMLPVITCFTAYTQSLSFIIDREMETQSTMAGIAMESLENSLYTADSYASSLLGLSAFRRYMCTFADAPQNELIRHMTSMFNSFPRLDDSNNLLSDFYVYSAASDSLLTARSGYLKPSLHYESSFALEGYDYDAWHSEILNDRISSRFLSIDGNDSSPQLLYSRRLYHSGVSGRILFYLNLDNMTDTFRHYGSDGRSEVFSLYDRSGNLLYTDADSSALPSFEEYGAFDGYRSIRLDGKKWILCSTPLSSHGLTLYITTPVSQFTRSALSVSLRILRGLIPLMLASTLLMFFLLRSSHHPIRQTLDDLPETDDFSVINPFKYIQQSTEHLSRENKHYEEQLQSSRFDLRSAMLAALIYEKTSSGFPLAEKLAELGISLSAPHYRGLVLTLYPPTEATEPLQITNRMHMMIQGLADSLDHDVRYLSMDGPDRMLFLALLDDSPDRMEQLQPSLSKLCWEISQTLGCEAAVYIGSECDRLEHVSRSFKSLRDIRSVRPSGGRYLVCARDGNDIPIYDYTSEDEKLLRHLAETGNAEALCEHLDAVRGRNSGSNSRTPFEKQLLYAHMIDTLIASGWHDPLSEELEHSLSDLPSERFFTLLKNHYVQLCQRSRKNEIDKHAELIHEILAYISANYSNYNLSLAELSVQFGLSDRRISSLIREQTGQGLPEYLEALRIDRAMELLCTSSRTIEEIALDVGYASDKSFRRAFKRRTGQSPSVIRTKK